MTDLNDDFDNIDFPDIERIEYRGFMIRLFYFAEEENDFRITFEIWMKHNDGTNECIDGSPCGAAGLVLYETKDTAIVEAKKMIDNDEWRKGWEECR